jgi:peptidyl-prolyl cis-trans isomerase C
MKLRSLYLAMLLTLAACGGAKDAGAPSGLIQLDGPASSLKVNGVVVPEALVAAYARKRGWELRDPGQREQAFDQLAELLAVAMEAEKRGLLADTEVRADLELERLNRLSGLMIERGAAAPSDEELRAEYDRQTAATGTTEYQVAHVLFDSAERAQQFIAALSAGSPFDDAMSSQKGQPGVRDAKDLGWVRRPQFPTAVGDAVAALQPGAYTPMPVQSDYGFHVVLLRNVRPFSAPSFDELKEGIRTSLQRKRALELAQSIKQKAKVER